MDGAEVVDADVGVALGCFEAGVAEHFGDVADVGSAFEEEGCDGVAEEVAAAFLGDAGVAQVALDFAGEPVGADWCADGGEEESFAAWFVGEAWAGEVEVEAEPEEGAFGDWDVAVFRAFAAADEDGGPLEVDVADGEVDQFLAAQGAGVEDFEDGTVAQAERARHIRLRQQRRHLGRAEGRFGKPPVRSRHQEIAGRVGRQLTAAPQPGEEVADRDQALCLSGDREGLAVSLAMLEQPPLVALQKLERNCVGRVDTVLLAEAGEVAETATPAANRRRRVVVYTHPEQVLLNVGLDRGHGRSSFPTGTERSTLGSQNSRRTSRLESSSVRRYYDPQTGQFISVDPAVDQTETPYAYVDGDPVDSTDPLGLGNFLSNTWDTVNPFSSSNYFRQSAEDGGLAASIVRYTDPAYLAVSGYVGAYDAWENGCSLSTVLGDAALGTFGAAGTVAAGLGGVGFAGGFIEGWSGTAAEDLPALTVDDAQFGAKVGKHAADYGLSPADPAARQYMRNLITDIRANPDEVRVGPWHPQAGGGNGYLFFRQGSNVVVTQPNGSFVTILKGGVDNGWFRGAITR